MFFKKQRQDGFNIVKKVKRLNRKGKLINTSTQVQGVVDEKKEIVASLMVKCDKSQQEVLEAFDDFHLKYEDGSISQKEFWLKKGNLNEEK